MARGLSQHTVLRAGYGAIIAVLVLSAVEAYQIQAGVSQQQLQIYRRYVDQEETLATLRRNLWLAGNFVRDFFIQTTPEQAQVLHQQLESLKKEDAAALGHLERRSGHTDVVSKLERSLGEFWAVVDPVFRTLLYASRTQQFDFLQREIVPRRGQLYNAFMDLTAADRQKLEESEGQFAETRRRAGGRLLLLLAISVLMGFLVARLSLRHGENLERQTERHLAEVEQARRELKQLSARLLEIEEEGRRRLARELHDEIGQTLALLEIEISHAQALPSAQAGVVRERLQRARELAQKTVQTVRNISLLLRPALLDDLGLVPALQFQLEEFLRRSGIACEFVEEGVEDHLPDFVKTCVYRVVQEALHNCEKHSAASKVRVVVRQVPECLTAEVEDNGCGFQLSDQGTASLNTGSSAGLGLLGIRERSAIAGGSLVINTALGHGTRVALRIPLPQTQPANTGVHDEVTA